MIGRILSNTKKHILRSGWVGFASVFVMTLAFLVAGIFGGLAYVGHLNVQYIESKSNMLVFFNVGMDQEIVDRLRADWENIDGIKEISYLSEEEAFEFYADYTSKVVPEIYQALQTFEDQKLPSSLEIKLNSLDNFDKIAAEIQSDIDVELEGLKIVKFEEEEPADEDADEAEETSSGDVDTEVSVDDILDREKTYKYEDESGGAPITLEVDNQNLTKLKDVFFKVRIAGVAALTLLFVFVVIFIFLTSEFRLYNQKDEIGVMQLVGGSLFFIRAPYILEGGFYGLVGALISSGIISGILTSIFIINEDSTLTQYIYSNFGQLPWPELTYQLLFVLIAGVCLVGFVIGSLSSYLSIRRYIR